MIKNLLTIEYLESESFHSLKFQTTSNVQCYWFYNVKAYIQVA